MGLLQAERLLFFGPKKTPHYFPIFSHFLLPLWPVGQQDQEAGERGSDGGGGGGGEEGEGEGLPPSIARAWRTFDVAKQIEHETREHQKAEEAKQQKKMRVT